MELLRLKEVMKEKGVTGVSLAEAVGITTTSVSNIVKGNNFPKPELLLNIARYLDVDVRELFHRTKINEGEKMFTGHVEYEGEVYTINTIEDLENLLSKARG